MSYELQVEEGLASGLRRIASEQSSAAIADLQAAIDYQSTPHDHVPVADGTEDVWDEGAHEARKAGKKIRAVARLCRDALGDAYPTINAQFRDASRLLADIRDAFALTETAAGLRPPTLPPGAHDELRRAVFERYLRIREQSIDGDVVQHALQAFTKAAADIPSWPLPADLTPAELAPSIGRVYRRGQRGLREAERTVTDLSHPATEAWHDWRKRVKYLRYHADLLGPADPESLPDLEDELHRLSDALGADHDLAMLSQTVDREGLATPESMSHLRPAVAERRQELRRQALAIAPPLYHQSPTVFTRRMVGGFARARYAPAIRGGGRSARRVVEALWKVGQAAADAALVVGTDRLRRMVAWKGSS